MVIELFCHEGGPRHEAKRLIEILELELLGNCVAVLDLAPPAELREGCGTSLAAKFLSHRCASVPCVRCCHDCRLRATRKPTRQRLRSGGSIPTRPPALVPEHRQNRRHEDLPPYHLPAVPRL